MTTGTGMHPSAATGALAVKDALHAAITGALQAASEHDVDVSYGYRWPAQHLDAVAVTALRASPLAGTLSPQRRRQVSVQVDVNVTAARPIADERVTHQRAFALLAVIDEAVRAEPTLAGAALWCLLGEAQSDGATVQDDDVEWGRVTEIAATFEAQIIVTS